MPSINYKNKKYVVDDSGYLVDPQTWDRDFAEGMAIGVRIVHQMTAEHWDVIDYIRKVYDKEKRCPTVFETSRATSLGLAELQKLFPLGYLRGACKLAGVSHKNIPPPEFPDSGQNKNLRLDIDGKVYSVDSNCYLIDFRSWDESYAEYLVSKSSIPDGLLTPAHRRIIDFLRGKYEEYGDVPTVYETCFANNISLEQLESLFPDGYHRGAVKIAGLRAG